MVVRWTDIAAERLKNIFDYYFEVAGHNAAAKIVTDIVNATDSLGIMPFMAQIDKDLTGREISYRSWAVNRLFKIVYFIDEKAECLHLGLPSQSLELNKRNRL